MGLEQHLGNLGFVKKLFINTGRSLEGYYPLGNKIVSGSVRDLSGNDFHGTVHGVTLTSDRNGDTIIMVRGAVTTKDSYLDF